MAIYGLPAKMNSQQKIFVHHSPRKPCLIQNCHNSWFKYDRRSAIPMENQDTPRYSVRKKDMSRLFRAQIANPVGRKYCKWGIKFRDPGTRCGTNELFLWIIKLCSIEISASVSVDSIGGRMTAQKLGIQPWSASPSSSQKSNDSLCFCDGLLHA